MTEMLARAGISIAAPLVSFIEQRALTGTLDSSADYFRAISGWLAASILFGLAHPISRTYVVLATGMGLVLGALYLATGNLLSAIVAHAVYDAVILVRWKREWIAEQAKQGPA
jgi:hypothetical protein